MATNFLDRIRKRRPATDSTRYGCTYQLPNGRTCCTYPAAYLGQGQARCEAHGGKP